MFLRGLSGTDRGIAHMLALRHEVDAARAFKALQRKNPLGTVKIMNDAAWSTHMRPRIVMEESGHANFLPPAVKRYMAAIRTTSGETRAIETALGRPAPYGTWWRPRATASKTEQRLAGVKPIHDNDRVAAVGNAATGVLGATILGSIAYGAVKKARGETARRRRKLLLGLTGGGVALGATGAAALVQHRRKERT
jgi:hypothetical protein